MNQSKRLMRTTWVYRRQQQQKSKREEGNERRRRHRLELFQQNQTEIEQHPIIGLTLKR